MLDKNVGGLLEEIYMDAIEIENMANAHSTKEILTELNKGYERS